MISFMPLKVLMLRKGLSIAALKKQGFQNVNFSKLFNNSTAVRTMLIDRLCKHFNCKLTDIVEYVPDEDWDFDRWCKKDITDPLTKLEHLSEEQKSLQKEIDELKRTYSEYLA